MAKIKKPTPGMRLGLDNDFIDPDPSTITPKSNPVLKQKNTKKKIKCGFDKSHFLITLTDGVKNKSIGITRAQMAQLFPKIKEFLHES